MADYDKSKDVTIKVVKPGVCEIRSYNGNKPRIALVVGTNGKGEPINASVPANVYDVLTGCPTVGADLDAALKDFEAKGGKAKPEAKVKAPSATAAAIGELAKGQAALADALAALMKATAAK